MSTANNDLEQVEKKAARKGATANNDLEQSPYSNYQKWRVDVETIRNGENVAGHKFTAVKKARGAVTKLSPAEADILNDQSHNNRIRYYLEDSITNGHEEEVML